MSAPKLTEKPAETLPVQRILMRGGPGERPGSAHSDFRYSTRAAFSPAVRPSGAPPFPTPFAS